MATGIDRWILIVEDNEDDEQLARRAFGKCERTETLLVARNGEEALEILRSRSSPVVVFLDLRLPRISGIEVLVEIKDDARLRTIPVVVLTSSDEMSDIGACYELGCSAFVRKPIAYAEFMVTLTRTFDFWLGTNLTVAEAARRTG
jgi:two-component system, response regulator